MPRLFSILAVALAIATVTLASCAQNAEPPGMTHAAAATTPASAPVAQQFDRSNPRFIAADLPLLPEGVERGARPVTVIQAGYEFAARHPEVLNYIPCFCGCERGGHKGNHDCFVTKRDEAGNVKSWEPHAIVCEVCLDVAYKSMQMHNSGASTAAIRDAIEKQYTGAKYHTPTPMPKRGARTTDNTFARLFDALHEGVFVGLIGPSGASTVAANPHLRLIFGWPEELELSSVRPFDPDRFLDDEARVEFLRRLTQDGQVQAYVLRLRRADGSSMWAEVTARADRQPGDHGHRIEAVVRDITERQKLQEQARDVYQQLLQAEKLAALGQTMSGVAHELNNPLATILACAERLASRELDQPTRRDLDAIHNAAERAARIVRNLQTFARKRHTTRTTVELNQVVRETVALRSHEQRVANVRIVDALAAGLPPVFADPHQIQQILLNLIINAEQAMMSAHGRGTLILRSWQDLERDAVILEVNDDGPGVPEDVQSKIFDPFFTTKAVGKGTGLGLTVAYAIAREHGGRLNLKSDGRRGASFFLELPVGGTSVRVPEAIAMPAAPSVPTGARALVVEDERALGEAVAATLTDEGFRVDRAEDGEEALGRLRERHYDVIICDLKMPKLDGMSFFAEVSKTMPNVARRLVFVTGDVAGSDAERFLDESGCRWIAKPFRLRDLVRVARETLQAT